MKMPYGEWKGYKIQEITTDYLEWVAEEWEDDEIREEAKEELAKRKDKFEL